MVPWDLARGLALVQTWGLAVVVPWGMAVVPWGGLLGALLVADDLPWGLAVVPWELPRPRSEALPWGLAVVPWGLPRPRSEALPWGLAVVHWELALLVLLAEHLPRPNFRGSTHRFHSATNRAANLPSPSSRDRDSQAICRDSDLKYKIEKMRKTKICEPKSLHE